jgi:hypothetical protein
MEAEWARQAPGPTVMLKLIETLFTARILSIALVVEVGFIVGVNLGRVEHLAPLQWAGAATALIGAALLAAMVHAWPEAPPAHVRRER